MIITELLAVLSISAAAGFRLALPLLLIGLLSGDDLWANVPLLSRLPPTVVVACLASWSLVELILSKDRPTLRFLQSLELLFSPVVGTISGIAIARTFALDSWIVFLTAFTGGLVALVIQLVQVGWLYRLRHPSLWIVFGQDFLCICLVFFAFDAPQHGGLIALLLLWLAIRTSNAWRQWYVGRSYLPPKTVVSRRDRKPD